MNGARDLSVLIHMKSKSPAIGKDTGVSLPVDIGCPLLSRHESKSVLYSSFSSADSMRGPKGLFLPRNIFPSPVYSHAALTSYF